MVPDLFLSKRRWTICAWPESRHKVVTTQKDWFIYSLFKERVRNITRTQTSTHKGFGRVSLVQPLLASYHNAMIRQHRGKNVNTKNSLLWSTRKWLIIIAGLRKNCVWSQLTAPLVHLIKLPIQREGRCQQSGPLSAGSPAQPSRTAWLSSSAFQVDQLWHSLLWPLTPSITSYLLPPVFEHLGRNFKPQKWAGVVRCW